MRYPDDHKQIVRAKIVAAASHALRRAGLDGVSIPSLMKEVGLTHGGFYVHFRDRDELVVEAVRVAAAATAANVLDREDGDVDAMLGSYLSSKHAAHPEKGCVLAALGTDAARGHGVVRKVFGETARGFVRYIQKAMHPSRARARPSDDALALASRMIGAVVLARLVDDEALAKRILVAARAQPRG